MIQIITVNIFLCLFAILYDWCLISIVIEMKLELDMPIKPKPFTKINDSRESCQDDALLYMFNVDTITNIKLK